MADPPFRAATGRPPAEWSPHRACWVAWPSHAAEWGAALAGCRRAVAELCKAIAAPEPRSGSARGESIELLALGDEGERQARAALGETPARIHRIPFGDIWLRDTGPLFVTGGDAPAAAQFRWTGWGGRYPFPEDPGVAPAVAESAGATLATSDLALEGGALESDGEGTILSTRSCLLSPSRNPGWSERGVEAELSRMLGSERIIWLDRGLRGDHTDGHIDNLARFVAPGRVACMDPAPGDPNAEVLTEIARTLAGARDAAGRRIELAHLPSPGAVVDDKAELLPASYLNFYIGNRAVVVPRFGTPADDDAARAVAALFPERRVASLDARSVLAGGGAFHCITRDEPSQEIRCPAS